VGDFSYGVWTDWRDTRGAEAGHDDLREADNPDEDDTGTPGFDGSVPADVYQCRHLAADGTVSGDTCPRLPWSRSDAAEASPQGVAQAWRLNQTPPGPVYERPSPQIAIERPSFVIAISP
jgi:hypothetical protein